MDISYDSWSLGGELERVIKKYSEEGKINTYTEWTAFSDERLSHNTSWEKYPGQLHSQKDLIPFDDLTTFRWELGGTHPENIKTMIKYGVDFNLPVQYYKIGTDGPEIARENIYENILANVKRRLDKLTYKPPFGWGTFNKHLYAENIERFNKRLQEMYLAKGAGGKTDKKKYLDIELEVAKFKEALKRTVKKDKTSGYGKQGKDPSLVRFRKEGKTRGKGKGVLSESQKKFKKGFDDLPINMQNEILSFGALKPTASCPICNKQRKEG